jgi:myo-inositol-1(or 4)-monophosphatase
VNARGNSLRTLLKSQDVQRKTETTGAPVPGDVLDIAIAAAYAAGAELTARFGHEPAWLARKRGIMDPVSDADRAAERAITAVLAERRPDDGVLAEEGTCDRAGTTGLRWVVDPLDGTVNFLAGIPLFCVSIACEDATGTVAGAILDPLRGELFAGARGGPLRIDGAPAPGPPPRTLAAAIVAGGAETSTDARAERAALLAERL